MEARAWVTKAEWSRFGGGAEDGKSNVWTIR